MGHYTGRQPGKRRHHLPETPPQRALVAGFLAVIGGIIFATVRAVKGPDACVGHSPWSFQWFSSGSCRNSRWCSRATCCRSFPSRAYRGHRDRVGVSLLRRFSIRACPLLIAGLTIAVLLPAVVAVEFQPHAGIWNGRRRLRVDPPQRSRRVQRRDRIQSTHTRRSAMPQRERAPAARSDLSGLCRRRGGLPRRLFAMLRGLPARAAEVPDRCSEYMNLFTQATEVARFTPPEEQALAGAHNLQVKQ